MVGTQSRRCRFGAMWVKALSDLSCSLSGERWISCGSHHNYLSACCHKCRLFTVKTSHHADSAYYYPTVDSRCQRSDELPLCSACGAGSKVFFVVRSCFTLLCFNAYSCVYCTQRKISVSQYCRSKQTLVFPPTATQY